MHKYLAIVLMLCLLMIPISEGWIGGGGDATCNTITCNLTDDEGYKFTNLDFTGTTGLSDGVDNILGTGVNINISKLNVTSTSYLIGSVGIGTTSPIEKLSVVDGSENSFNGISIQNTRAGSAARGGISLYNKSGISIAEIVVNNDGESSVNVPGDASNLVINQKVDSDIVLATNNTERIRVTNNGLVGIGTNGPDAPLDIKANIIDLIHLDRTANAGVSTVFRLGVTTTDAMAIGRDGQNDLYIDDSGNVGIGTTAPSELLEVAGDFRINETNGCFGSCSKGQIAWNESNSKICVCIDISNTWKSSTLS